MSIKMRDIKLNDFIKDDDISGNSVVACPSCGETYTHHIGIESITRYNEDSEKGTRVTVRGHNVSFSDDAQDKNPSTRRDSVSIRFYCEQGCDDFIIEFVQHKGTTSIACDMLHGQSHIGSGDDDA